MQRTASKLLSSKGKRAFASATVKHTRLVCFELPAIREAVVTPSLCLGQVESRTTGPCGNLEQMRFRRQPKPGNKTIIFIDRQPAVLADVDAENFLLDDLKNMLVELAVGIRIEIDAFCHVKLCYGSIVGITRSRSDYVGVS